MDSTRLGTFWTILSLAVSAGHAGSIEPIKLCSAASNVDNINNTGVIRYEGDTLPCSLSLEIPPHTNVTFFGSDSTCSIVSCPLSIDLKLNSELFCPVYGSSYTASNPSSSAWRLNVNLTYGPYGQAVERPSFDFSFKTRRLMTCGSHANAQGFHNFAGEFYFDSNLSSYTSSNCYWSLGNIPNITSRGGAEFASVLFEVIEWGSNATGVEINSVYQNLFVFNSTHQDPKQLTSFSFLRLGVTDTSSSPADWRVVLKYTVLVCDDPPALENASAMRNGTPYEHNGTTIPYSCLEGYSWNNSIPSQRRCLFLNHRIQWISVSDSQCIPDAECEADPKEIKGTKFTISSSLRGTYTCADGYHHAEGSAESLTIECKSMNNRPYVWEAPSGVLICIPDSLASCEVLDLVEGNHSLCKDADMVPNCCVYSTTTTQCMPEDCEEDCGKSWIVVAIVFIVLSVLLGIALIVLLVRFRPLGNWTDKTNHKVKRDDAVRDFQPNDEVDKVPDSSLVAQRSPETSLNDNSRQVLMEMAMHPNGLKKKGQGADSQTDTNAYYNVDNTKKPKKKKNGKIYENESAIRRNERKAQPQATAYVNQAAAVVYDQVADESPQLQLYQGPDMTSKEDGAYEEVGCPQKARHPQKALMPPKNKLFHS